MYGVEPYRGFESLPLRHLVSGPNWNSRAKKSPENEIIQDDGRIRRWVRIPEMDNRYLRVVFLSDGETVHNAFFDRVYKP